MSATIGAIVNNLHNVEKEIELYANKLHRVNQWIEVSIFYNLLLFSKNGMHTSYHSCYAYIYFPLLEV